MLERNGKLYCTTKEAAEHLGIKQTSIGDAVWRRALAATEFPDILHRKFIEAGELDRYRQQRKGRSGWEKRRAPNYQPNGSRAAYQRAYRARRRKRREAEVAENSEGGL